MHPGKYEVKRKLIDILVNWIVLHNGIHLQTTVLKTVQYLLTGKRHAISVEESLLHRCNSVVICD